MVKVGEGELRRQTCSDKSQGCNVQRGDYDYIFSACTIYLLLTTLYCILESC